MQKEKRREGCRGKGRDNIRKRGRRQREGGDRGLRRGGGGRHSLGSHSHSLALILIQLTHGYLSLTHSLTHKCLSLSFSDTSHSCNSPFNSLTVPLTLIHHSFSQVPSLTSLTLALTSTTQQAAARPSGSLPTVQPARYHDAQHQRSKLHCDAPSGVRQSPMRPTPRTGVAQTAPQEPVE